METIKVTGMTCPKCVAAVQKALEALPGISDVQVDLEKGEASYNGSVTRETACAAIDDIGFDAA